MRTPKLVRRLTDPMLEGLRVPILAGTNRGYWWSLVSAGSGYGTGLRSSSQTRLVSALLRPGDVVWDVGAHHGFITLCASRKVGDSGRVHAFEPSARNQRVLRRHVVWNNLLNVVVHPYALSSFNGRSGFGGGGTSKTWSLGAGPETVDVRTADDMVARDGCTPPTFLKIDVEGAEADVVAGAMSILSRGTRLLIAMHSRDADRRCVAFLRDMDFEMIASRALAASRAGSWVADPDLFCIGPEYRDRDRDLAVLRRGLF